MAKRALQLILFGLGFVLLCLLVSASTSALASGRATSTAHTPLSDTSVWTPPGTDLFPRGFDFLSSGHIVPDAIQLRTQMDPSSAFTAAQLTSVEPVVQVSSSSDWEERAAMAMGDGLLWAVWERCCSSDRLWYATSADDGDTWSQPQPLTDNAGDDGPSMATDRDGHAWLAFQSGRAGNTDIWVMHTTGGGAWTTPARVTTDPAWEGNVAIVQAGDGSVLVAFQSDRSGNVDVWLTSSSDGLVWSAPVQMTTDPGYDADVDLARLLDGTLWMVWHSDKSPWGLWARTSTDNGHTWSAAAPIVQGDGEWQPSLTQDASGTMWLFWLAGRSKNDDLWYATSTDGGSSWSTATQFTRFFGGDRWPHVAWLPADAGMSDGDSGLGAMGLLWGSNRAGNYDVWFARLGTHGDVNPPPYVDEVYHDPEHNPDSNDVVTVHARVADESGVQAVHLLWTLNGSAQPDLTMYDDGAHDDFGSGDKRYGAQFGPFAAGSQITYRIRATDTDGNTFTSDSFSFSILDPLPKTADILLVADYRWSSDWFLPYFTAALDAGDYAYDVWECWIRGPVDAGTLLAYADGVVIWATPRDWGYLTDWPWQLKARANLQAYLDAGGSLFITGQFLGERNQGTPLLQQYLHARYVQDNVGLYTVMGAGDIIGGDLVLSIQGGDGANDQWTPDEVDTLAPARQVFLYDTSTPIMTVQARESDAPWEMQLASEAVEAAPVSEAEAAGIISSGTAALRVSTGTYKVVYFAFGFEAIAGRANRAIVMDRVLAWLRGTSPRPLKLSPENGTAVPVGDVTFAWTALPAATGYQIQIDLTNTFTSPALISATLSTTSYTATLTMGTWYWRVRALPDGAWTAAWQVRVAAPVLQVTTSSRDHDPAVMQASDGRLWLFFQSYRASGYSYIWYQTSTDGGDTWSTATRFTGEYTDDYDPAVCQTEDGKLWVVWYSYRSGYGDLYYKTSSDNGVTWSSDVPLTTDLSRDRDPDILRAGGKVWVVWKSERSGNGDIWYKTTADGGATWSADMQLTASSEEEARPSLAQTQDGAIVVLWQRNGRLWHRRTLDGGTTWSAEVQVSPDCCQYNPSLVVDHGGVLWLASDRDGDLWYRTSEDGGATWSASVRLTRYVGPDECPDLALLQDGRIAWVWQSERANQWYRDIYYGVFGRREDVSPPPWAGGIGPVPDRPLSTDTVAVRITALDESPGVQVALLWWQNGITQTNLTMYDDGAHGDSNANDNLYGVQIGPFAAGTVVEYQAQVTDSDGNVIVHPPSRYFFRVIAPFSKTADILFVPDCGGSDTSSYQPYFTVALDSLGQAYDVWDTGLRGPVPASTLLQYAAGVVIWSTPAGGYVTDSGQQSALQAYLDAGGKLFITGQQIAEYLNNTSLLTGYLHAHYVQPDTNLSGVKGAVGDPIGNGLKLGIARGDGANNQWSPDEVDPIAPAVSVFYYDPEITPPPYPAPGETVHVLDIISSGTAALRVDTATYRVVYFAFGFEAINRRADRAAVMERVLSWLRGTSPRPMLLSPVDGSAVPVGAVAFSWASVAGVDGYQVQIDASSAFTSPALISATVSTASYTATLTMGTWYWRVRALPDGAWTAAWQVRVSAPVVPVTTHTSNDYDPSIVQATDGKLWVVWYSYRSGNSDIWLKTSSDGGATWSMDVQLTTDTRDDYGPAITQAADGKLWVVWYSYRSGNYDIWFKTSSDGGATWSMDVQLTTDTRDDYGPGITQAVDGKLWVVWCSYRSGNADIWYKTTSDGGLTWSPDTQLTTYTDYDYEPAIAQTVDGRLWVVWSRGSMLWYRTSSDGGATWSSEARISGHCCYSSPSLAVTGDGTLWLASYYNRDIWYQTTSDGGTTWTAETKWTRFAGYDELPALAALNDGSVAMVWDSDRAVNYDIWFGIFGQREDVNPPPYISDAYHLPGPNPDSNATVTVRARVVDETALRSVHLVWTRNGTAQTDLAMYDDGAHNDSAAGDGWYGAQIGPLPAGEVVAWQIRAVDSDGNSVTAKSGSFTVLEPFSKTANILLVADQGPYSDTAWFRKYYAQALDDGGWSYDLWDVRWRGAPDASVLNQYGTGSVVWAAPASSACLFNWYWWQYCSRDATLNSLRSYLDGGGKLFISGQNIADALRGDSFLANYLHAQYVQYNVGLYRVTGQVGDPIGQGLALGISGGDGANNQSSPDEIDPIAPAVTVFRYDSAAMSPLAEPVQPQEPVVADNELLRRSADARQSVELGVPLPERGDSVQFSIPCAECELAQPPPVPDKTQAAGIISSGTAALRVDTGTYKVVYFAFGFEAINTQRDRAIVMSRVLSWLGVSPELASRDVTIHKSLSSGRPEPGGVLTYTLAYANRGTLAAGGVLITDTLPADTIYVSSSGPVTPTLDGRTLSWNLGALPGWLESGSTGLITVTIRLPITMTAGTWIENVARISTSDVETESMGSGLIGHYYQYDGDALGAPPTDPFTNGVLKLQRGDPVVDFFWGSGTPQLQVLYPDWFAVRWTGYVYAPRDGTYTFATVTDDGARLWVNGIPVVDDWRQHGMETHSGKIALTGGQWYSVQYEFEEFGGDAGARLYWEPPGTSGLSTVPQRYLSPEPAWANNSSRLGLRVLPPLKSADILLVLDYGGNDTDWFRPYYTSALNELGYAYDIWDTEGQGRIESWALNQWVGGTVIWSTPYWGHIIYSEQFTVVQSFLDHGGRLFLTSQETGYYLHSWGNTGFLNNYLHAQFVQDNVGMFRLSGKSGDAVSDGLTALLSGGDGANNQGDCDELDPVAPAVTVFTYGDVALASGVASVRPADYPPPQPGATPAPTRLADRTSRESEPPHSPEEAAALGVLSSGTAGLRVDTGTYKVVYFGFGLEGINQRGMRQAVLERVLAWLRGVPPRLMQLSPTDGSAVGAGDVGFAWSSVPAVSGYQVQIDRTAAFTSPALISATLSTTSYTATLTLGTWYWRARTLPGGAWTAAWQVLVAAPVVPVTTHTSDDYEPSIVQATDGKLWVVWYSNRSGNYDIWYKTSSDGGATWSMDVQLTTDTSYDYGPAITQAADGKLWVVWYSYRSGNSDIWLKTSGDGGVTWSTDTRLTTDPNSDYRPAIIQAADGRLWVVWYSYRSGNADIWYKTTSDGGVTWSPDTQLTTHTDYDYEPAIAQAADGKLWVLWYSYRSGSADIWYRTTADGGATWSGEARLTTSSDYEYSPTMVRATDGTLWLMWYRYSSYGSQLWYQTSRDNGGTWSAERQWTRFVGYNQYPALAALSDGSVAVVWSSDRLVNSDIWFGVLGQREDVNPPPHVGNAYNLPGPNPDSEDTVTMRAQIADESAMSSAALVWARDGTPQADLSLYDDGGHNDSGAGDGWYGVQIGPFPAGTQIAWQVRAVDSAGNVVLWPLAPRTFQVLEPVHRTADILFVADRGPGNDTSAIRNYYGQAFADGAWSYDLWDVGWRGAPDASVLNQYRDGAVVWASPETWGACLYSWYDQCNRDNTLNALRSYLDGGGNLFISGQNVGENLNGNSFFGNYLHAQYVQYNVGLYRVTGQVGDPIGQGLALGISGGDGANNQSSPDEIDPIAPAVAVFRYDSAAMSPLAEPVRPQQDADAADPSGALWLSRGNPATSPCARCQQALEELPQPGDTANAAGIVSSGTAALRVDTGTYKVVYFAFGFEAINRRADRATVMGRVLSWLGVTRPPAVLRLQPQSQTVYLHAEPFTVEVHIDQAFDLGGFEFTVQFDPAVVHVEDVVLGSFLGSTGRATSTVGPVIDNVAGTVAFAAKSTGSAAGPQGSGRLAAIRFSAVGAGTSTLTVRNVQLVDTAGEATPHSVQGGSITVASTLLRFEPASATVNKCVTESAVSLDVLDVTNLGAFTFTLHFDPNVLHVQSITLGGLITGSARTFAPLGPQIDNKAGVATFGASSSGTQPGPTGSGSIAAVTFTPAGAGLSSMDLPDVHLSAADGAHIPVFVQQGSITVPAGLTGDVDCDCDVDIVDIILVASHWGTRRGEPDYMPIYDLDRDGDIDIVDIMMVAADWGLSCNGAALARPAPRFSAGHLLP